RRWWRAGRRPGWRWSSRVSSWRCFLRMTRWGRSDCGSAAHSSSPEGPPSCTRIEDCMQLTLALLAGLGAAGLVSTLLLTLGRTSFLVRRLAFPLYVAAAAAGLFVFTLLPAGATPAAGSPHPSLCPLPVSPPVPRLL